MASRSKWMKKSLERWSDYFRETCVDVTDENKVQASSTWPIDDALLTSKDFVVSRKKRNSWAISPPAHFFCRRSCVKLLFSVVFMSIHLKQFSNSFLFRFLLLDFLMSTRRSLNKWIWATEKQRMAIIRRVLKIIIIDIDLCEAFDSSGSEKS